MLSHFCRFLRISLLKLYRVRFLHFSREGRLSQMGASDWKRTRASSVQLSEAIDIDDGVN